MVLFLRLVVTMLLMEITYKVMEKAISKILNLEKVVGLCRVKFER